MCLARLTITRSLAGQVKRVERSGQRIDRARVHQIQAVGTAVQTIATKYNNGLRIFKTTGILLWQAAVLTLNKL
jgi:hypothetical protein